MIKSSKFNRLFLLLLITAGIYSCDNNKDDVNPEPAKVQLQFNFKHSIGDDELEFDTIQYANTFGNNYGVSTLKYFISDFALINKDGIIIRLNEEHYVDATDESTMTFVPAKKIAAGYYSAILFIFGLSEEKNHTGRYPNPPENNMEWPVPMGGGYHYMKLEGKFNNNDTIKNYQCHTGPTMGNPNFVIVTLPESSFTTSGLEMTFNIEMDINKWFENPNILDLNDITGIMGNQEMQLKLQANGLDAFTLESKE